MGNDDDISVTDLAARVTRLARFGHQSDLRALLQLLMPITREAIQSSLNGSLPEIGSRAGSIDRLEWIRRVQEDFLEPLAAETRFQQGGAVRQALASGMGPTDLAESAGLSRARIYQLRDSR